MTDEIECPDCNGAGQRTLGRDREGRPFLIGCRFCLGRGIVGGAYEPAEDPPLSEDDGPADLGWDAQGVERPPGCPTCAGAGEILSLGGDVQGGRPTRGGKMPCPACRPSAAAS